jgi:hypothetical protein
MPAPDPKSENWGDMPQFRTMRRMVTVLTATMIVGIAAIFAVITIRIASEPAAVTVKAFDAEVVVVPAGEVITASGVTRGAISLVTRDAAGVERLRVFDPTTGAAVDIVEIGRE